MQYIGTQPLEGSHKKNVERNNHLDKTIMVVEDDESIGSLLVEALSQETPYHALLVTDGLQALKLLRKVKPCLFITDYSLPYMNGIELYDHLHATKDLENTPTIIMSAYLPLEEVKKRNMISLNKPFDLDVFLDTVENLLHH